MRPATIGDLTSRLTLAVLVVAALGLVVLGLSLDQAAGLPRPGAAASGRSAEAVGVPTTCQPRPPGGRRSRRRRP